MDRAPIIVAMTVVAVLTISVASLAGPGELTPPEPISAGGAEYWPGMWIWSSETKKSARIGGGPIHEAWRGPAVYLRHPDAGYREGAAKWLRALGEHAEPAVPDLLAILDDESVDVRQAAVEALDRVFPEWRARSAEDLLRIADEAPKHVKVKCSIKSYGFPLRGRQAVFLLEGGAEFGIEVTIDSWWGRPWPADLDLALRDTVVFGIADPERFAEEHFSDSDLDEYEGEALDLTLMPRQRPDGLWSFELEKAEVFDVFVIPDA